MIRAVGYPVLEHLFQRDLAVALGVKAALAECLQPRSAQYTQIVEAVHSKLRDQLRDRRFGVAEMLGPRILINGCKLWVLVGQHLPEPIGENNFGIGKVPYNFVNAPFSR